jgi:C-terminal processing protease CtpA/Prc
MDEVLDESDVRRFDDAETVAEMVEGTIEQGLVQQRCADKSKLLYIPGLVCAADPLGLKVTGFVKGSSAASSALQIGDVVIEVKGELVIGLSSVSAIAKMSGVRDSEVALTAIRKNKKRGGKERISAYVLRDVKNACSDGENASGNKARALKSSAPRALATVATQVLSFLALRVQKYKY